MRETYSFNDAVFTYLVCNCEVPEYAQHISLKCNGLIINLSKRTEYKFASENGADIHLLGLCVDSKGELSEDEIPSYIAHNCERSIVKAAELSGRFAGTYCIICCWNEQIYAFSDAIGCMQINYLSGLNNVAFSSHDSLLARYASCSMSEEGVSVRTAAPLYQPMPYDLTVYNNIKVNLPNHYLDVQGMRSVRYWPKNNEKQVYEPLDKAVDASVVRIRNIVKAYLSHYRCVEGFTAGWDSRVVFAFMKEDKRFDTCFSFKHPKMQDTHDDIVLPRTMAKRYKINYSTVPDCDASEDYVKSLKEYAGEYIAIQTINMGHSFLSAFSDTALINGNIVEQMGRNLVGLGCPSCFASIDHFMVCAHNYSIGARRNYTEQLKEIKACKPHNRLFDLFDWENFCGRWVTQGAAIYSLMGIVLPNIFNCRDVLKYWVSIDPKERVKKKLHLSFMEKLDKSLLEYPINPSKPPVKLHNKLWYRNLIVVHIKVMKKR